MPKVTLTNWFARMERSLRRFAVTLSALSVLMLAVPTLASGQDDSALKSFIPQTIAPPRDEKYLQADGSIYIAGNDLLVPYIERLNELFVKTHAGTRRSL